MSVQSTRCQHFHNLKAPRPLGWRRWNLARTFCTSVVKTRNQNFEFQPLRRMVNERTKLPDVPSLIADRRHSLFRHICRLPENTPASQALQSCRAAPTDRSMSSSTCCCQFLRGRPGGRFQSAAGGVPVWASIDSSVNRSPHRHSSRCWLEVPAVSSTKKLAATSGRRHWPICWCCPDRGPGSFRCGGCYNPQLVKRSSEWVSECAAWGDPEISPVGRDDAPIAGTYFVYIFVSVEMCAISVIYSCMSAVLC